MRNPRLDELFDAAQSIAPAQRGAWLTEVCGDDAALRQALERLLAAEARADEVLGSVSEQIAQVLATPVDEPQAFGVWRVKRPLGAGGMGEVWLGERDDAGFVQRAAIKQVAYPTPGLLQRFERERQILARLEHPGIARLIDGGVDDSGCPYLAMEYVEGVPIDQWVHEQSLDVRSTVQLWLQVCESVEFAHRNLVVHSDIKPSNILVGQDGKPRLLDFGIAKVLSETGDPGTRTATRLLTPDYAAPEWLAGGAATTAVDVYALGVLAYELVSGHKPYQIRHGGAGLARQLADTPTQPPSSAVAAQRADVRTRRRALRGDLDRVVMTAMAADPARRYASVAALASDLRSWLGGRPVLARSDSGWYRLRKFVARNRVATAIVAVAVLALVGATIFSLRQARAARQQAARAETVTHFLTDMFRFADPRGVPGGLHMTAKQMLDAGAQRFDRELRTQPELAAKFATTLGTIYTELAQYQRAIELAGGALTQPGISRGARAHAYAVLARAQYGKGDYKAAQKSVDQAKVLHAAEDGKSSASVAADIALAGEIARRQGHFKQAEQLTKRALAMSRATLKAPNAQIASQLNQLGVLYGDMHRPSDERAPTEKALAMFRALYGDNQLDVAENTVNLGVVDMQTGKLDEAIPLFEKAEAVYHKLLPGDHPMLANALVDHARALDRAGRYREAKAKYAQALAMQRRLLGDDHPDLAATLNNMAVLEFKMGDFHSAAEHSRKALAIWNRQGKPNHPLAQISRIHLGAALCELGELAQSESMLRASRALATKTLGANKPITLVASLYLGDVLRRAGKTDESLALEKQVDADARASKRLPPLIKTMASVQYALSEMAAGDPSAARARMQAVRTTLGGQKPLGPVARGEIELAQARIDIAAGDATSGCAVAKLAAKLAADTLGNDNVRTARARKVADGPACRH